MTVRVRALFLATLLTACAVTVHAAPAPRNAAAPALPDTGLFAPVAKQYRARLERLASREALAADERALLLLATGQSDAALALMNAQADRTAADRVVHGRVLLARYDFAAETLIEAGFSPSARASVPVRALHYAALAAHDDAPAIDSLTRAAVAGHDDANAVPELLAAGRLAYDRLDYTLADSCWKRVLAVLPATGGGALATHDAPRRAAALTGRALVQQKRRDWDGSLATLRAALETDASASVLIVLTETLIRLGRTDEAISAGEWAVKLDPYHESSHYLIGNGYARKNYTQLAAAYPGAFATREGRTLIARADALLGSGRRAAARAAYARIVVAHPRWVDARVRLASLDFEDGRFAEARDGCFAALRTCPEYGRAHAVLAKALEGQRFVVDVHRADYEARFAALPTPVVPGIERFVDNWKSLSPRHQKRVALSVAPWASFVPVLVEGGATYFIKPMYMLLSECPAQATLRDQRINYDSRLWDDVRGAGGYHTVTGIEDVERTIFDRYNTVLHELTHQVHGVLPAEDSRLIQEHYRLAKERDDVTRDGYLSRYAGGSVYEYFAEGANALASPMRDTYDPRDVVRERLDRIDPALRRLVEGFMARTDVSGSYPIAYAGGGDDRVERGQVDEALPFYRKALERDPANETALLSYARALGLANRAAEACTVATRATQAHPTSGSAVVTLWDADWHAKADPRRALQMLQAARAGIRAEDRYLVDIELGRLAWVVGDAAASLAAYDSVLAYQSDSPEGMQGRAAALALAGRADEAFAQYEQAVRMRTGVVGLRCAFASDLLDAGRIDAARAQLDAARLLDERHPEAEALRARADLEAGKLAAARQHVNAALAWGSWCDLAHIV